MTEEFIKWAEGVKSLIRKRAGESVQTWMLKKKTPFTVYDPDTVSIGITLSNGMLFWFGLHQKEFDKNNGNQRRRLAKIRRENMAIEMQEHCREVQKIAKCVA